MKRTLICIVCLVLTVCFLSGCAPAAPADIAATTMPVYTFTQALCAGTPLTVARLITQDIACLHDYTLNVDQVKTAEAARFIVISGAGLEDSFLQGLLVEDKLIDASAGIPLLCPGEEDHEDHEAHDHHGHTHDTDPHIWLDPENAMVMAENICQGLSLRYPQYRETFEENLRLLLEELDALLLYGRENLSSLACREMITFHDGFAYFAGAFDLTILEAVEEESGSEASARELIHLISLTSSHGLPAVFTEVNSSASAADVIARETGAAVFQLDMAMSGSSYFDAMYHNISTVKEALG